MELKIDSDSVLKAVEKFPEAKKALETLLPSVFEEEKYFDFSGVEEYFLLRSILPRDFNSNFLKVRGQGNLSGKGFFLSSALNWEIIKDDEGELVLLPTRKKEYKDIATIKFREIHELQL